MRNCRIDVIPGAFVIWDMVSIMTVDLTTLRWRHNGHNGVSNHQLHHCLLNHLFGCRSKKTSKLRVTGLCAGNSPGTGEFPAQMASNAENVSIWWRNIGRGMGVLYDLRIWTKFYISRCRNRFNIVLYSTAIDPTSVSYLYVSKQNISKKWLTS